MSGPDLNEGGGASGSGPVWLPANTFRNRQRPFTNVVNMRTSPAHKFLFAFGDQFAWFPYQVEPWHWEYNPEGFSEAFPSGDWSVTDPFVPPPSNSFDP